MINLKRMLCCFAIDAGENVIFDTVLFKQPEAAHNKRVRRSALDINTILVMQKRRPIEAQTDQKFVFSQKGAPVIIQQGAVCLQ